MNFGRADTNGVEVSGEQPETPFVRVGQPIKAQIGGPANPFWKWVFPIITVAALIAVPYLFIIGGRAVLDTEGAASLAQQVQNPLAPGYQAFITPSPTALVVVLDNDDDVVGAALFASAGDTGGGTIAVISPSLDLPIEDGDPKTVRDTWTDGGAEDLIARSSQLFGIVVDQVLEARPSDLVVALGEADPLQVSLLDPLVDEDGNQLFGRGLITLEGADVPAVFAALGPNESELNRSDRQVKLWAAWIDAANEVDEDPDRGLAWHLAGFARASANVVLLPGNEGGPAALVDSVVPFPVLAGESRPTVRLVNEQFDPALNRPAVEAIARAGGLPTVLGNPMVASGEPTHVQYFDQDHADAASAIAAALGTGDARFIDPATAAEGVVDEDFAIVAVLGPDYDVGVADS